MQSQFTAILRTSFNIPKEEMSGLVGISRHLSIKKNNYFLMEGDPPYHLGFVMRGLFRYYYIDRKGNEFTKGFMPEHSFLSAYDAIIERRPSFYTIEALEDSEVLMFDYLKWKELIYPHHDCWKEFLIKLIEKGYAKKVTREREFLLLDAEQRYQSFMKNYPGLEKRVKQHLIASYLGITSVALSRVRKKMGLVNIS